MTDHELGWKDRTHEHRYYLVPARRSTRNACSMPAGRPRPAVMRSA
nr:TPA_asm: m169.5 sORF [Murid betaherpesvirus 1]DBA07917.1 TPA_asm: m169.5 sORF [Murid betaherpesvirus 1]